MLKNEYVIAEISEEDLEQARKNFLALCEKAQEIFERDCMVTLSRLFEKVALEAEQAGIYNGKKE